MVMEALEKSVITHLRSSAAIDSVTQCVTELVLNSLDAKSSAIAVRVNLATFRIQIVDNGKGISRQNLELVGQRYMTNKCHSLVDLRKRLKHYGFKGEALANISKICHRVSIASRAQNCDETYCKIIEQNDCEISLYKARPSFGTTVTVEGFLSNLPVRQQCVKSSELDNVKKNLESLVIIHPRVSFSLRNDAIGKIMLDSRKSLDIAASFKNIHPEIDESNFVLFRVSKSKTSVEGLIHRDFHDKRLQYIYVNKRPITCPTIQNMITSRLKKAQIDPKKSHPVFVVHIKCPYSDIDLNLEPSKITVYFKKVDIINRCIEKIVATFLGKENAQTDPEKAPANDAKSEFGVSQIGGAVKALGLKRRSENLEAISSAKSPKIEQPKMLNKQAAKALPVKRNEKQLQLNLEDMKENSLYTEFPENERKGKDIIMDMFIKSVQVFPEENKSSEVEELKVVKTPPKEAEVVKDKMVSVGVQAGPGFVNPVADDITDITFYPRKPLTRFVSDYDFDFSRVNLFPSFNFNRKLALDPPLIDGFDQTKKLFDFRDSKKNVSEPLPPLSDLNETFYERQRNFPEMAIHQKKKPRLDGLEKVQESPYFRKKNKQKPLKESFQQIVELSQNRNNEESKFDQSSKNIFNVEMSCSKRNKARKKLNESTVSSYFAKKPAATHFKSKSSQDSFLLESKICSPENKTESAIIITVEDEEERQNIIDRGLLYENQLKKDELPSTFGQSQIQLKSTQSDWIKEVNIFGTVVYTNQKSGVKSLKSPKEDLCFEVAERYDFVPKGLSPILKDHGKVESLSPEAKNNFNNAVVQSYGDELLLVKWQNYIDTKDPKKFFREVYLEKSKLIENAIPNVNKSALAKREIFENVSFTKDVFKNLEVIGQVDCKFIAALEKTRNLIILFDQHAVHERVRLEELTEGYKNGSTKLDQNIMIFLPHNELSLVKSQKTTLHSLGLIFDVYANGINIYQVPLCLYNKFHKGANLLSLTEALVGEIIDILKTNNGILVFTPRIIQNIVNSEACRGAIKFGDYLSKTECVVHLSRLVECVLPFQCAHGRPTLTPLISLKEVNEEIVSKPRLHILKQK